MASLTKYAGTVSQSTGGNYRTFSDLVNIKNNVDGSWANSNGNIKGKNSSPNRPSNVSCTNFSFNLPTGAEVSRVRVYYRHKKTGSLNIPAPTLTLLGVSGSGLSSAKGAAPTTSMVTHYQTWTTSKITRSMVNSSSFGVKLDYPTNTNSSEGTVSISYVRVEVTYKVPSYSLTLKKVSGGYNEESYTVEASISNTNLTGYNPSVTLTAPTGFSFTNFDGTGEYTVVSPTVISWNPKFTSKVPSSTALFKFDVDVTYPSGQSSYTGTFTLSESLYSGSKSLSATITDRPAGEGSETDPDAPPIITDDDTSPVPIKWEKIEYHTNISAKISSDMFNADEAVVFGFPANERGEPILSEQNTPISLKDNNTLIGDITTYSGGDYTGNWLDVYTIKETVSLSPNKVDKYVVYFFNHTYDYYGAYWSNYKNETPIITYYFECIPKENQITVPFFTVLEPSEEELNRLGTGFTYIAQSDINHTTTDTNVRDWYKNNRIGIYNNEAPLFIDKGTTSNYSNWDVVASTMQMTRQDTYTELKRETDASAFGYIVKELSVTDGITIEFDFKQATIPSSNDQYLSFRDSQGNTKLGISRDYQSLNDGEWHHYKLVVNGLTVTPVIDGVQKPNLTLSGNWSRIQLEARNNAVHHFKNLKIVSNNPTIEEIFNTAEYWSKATGGLNEYNNCECEFTYDSQYPLYILMTGDYPEAETYGYDMGSIKYDTPCIVEKQVYKGRERNGTYPTPIEALLSGEDIATLQLAKDQTSQGAVLYSFPVDETISTNDKLAIRGLQVRANIEATDNLVIQAKLHSPTGEVGNRSILVDSQDEEIVIGGLGDLWGFTTLQMTHLELWQLELSVANILSQSDSTILFNNVEIIFYLETVEKQEITIKVEDEDIAYYGAFIETVKIPEGLNTDTSFLSIDGTDTNDAYRQNIREKTITIEFNLSNCELQTSTDMLRQLTKLFVNEKDQYNRPIPKRIQFSHYPNDYFEYIMEEPFDVDTDITDYTIKAQLTVPSGTSYSLYDTVTNTTGNANGLAAVNPIITVRPSDVNIQVSETNSGQTFNIAYTGDWNDHTVEIDCEDRKVYLIKGEDERIDISKYADYNSDWFRLDGEYEFSSVNCTILSVIFNERW